MTPEDERKMHYCENTRGANSAREKLIVKLERSVSSAAAAPSERVLQVAAMFGLGIDRQREMAIVPQCEIPIVFPGIVFVTGPSGGGKSTILSLLESELQARGVHVLRMSCIIPNFEHASAACDLAATETNARYDDRNAFDDRSHKSEASCPHDLPDCDDRPLVDQIGATLEQGLSILARVGLSDAFAMLRRTRDLSDGQRARFALARVIEIADAAVQRGERIAIIADEFAATLDRTMAMTIARNLRRWVSGWAASSERGGVCLIAATTHDDLLEALQPEVLVWKSLGDEVEVLPKP